ncbi:undecaprenyl-diphosphatase UppP [Methanobrevibacter ruminantium M1]|uniref:Undecaprenyl-diphosphatase n=1 Tax=Methanobrevibacter ruminantium (strain ATCC 35063 / DSM 1093 / JCM 13430 / OCM 146 / M1) TaxID=634498 RepID=D3E0Y4_METRM|nr:undecaprenyl-diphosphate phosphatase [Methanobrevibacter ruminantium]ADC47958.1 undecaprenyl-diphosphatase UppP [Methanobrevibacter ruminantium M1]
MDILQAIIIGLVQGLTEFLPVSSSAHLIFIQQALGLSNVPLAFDVLLHVGTLVAVFVYFFSDIIQMIQGFFYSLLDLRDGNFIPEIRRDPYKKLAWLTIIATIPVGVVGILFNDIIEEMFTGLTIPAFLLLITGCLLYVSQRMNSGKIDVQNITIKEALLMGCGQAIAVLPGLSRSGTTIAAGLFAGLDKEFAAKFSFILSIPAILGAAVVQLKDLSGGNIEIGACLVGFIVAVISGYFAISFLLKIVREKSLDIFAYYCWIVGVIVLVGSILL